MTQRKPTAAEAEQVALEVGILAADPYGVEADHVLEAMVVRYNQVGQELLARSGLMAGRQWPAWLRLLQVRFVNLVCQQSPGAAAAVTNVLAKRPPLDAVLRETLRAFFVGLKDGGSKAGPAKAPEAYWEEALASLQQDIDRWRQEGTAIGETTPEHFRVLGVDYSLSPAEWLAASEE